MSETKYKPENWHYKNNCMTAAIYTENDDLIAIVVNQENRRMKGELLASAPDMFKIMNGLCKKCPSSWNNRMPYNEQCKNCEIGRIQRRVRGVK